MQYTNLILFSFFIGSLCLAAASTSTAGKSLPVIRSMDLLIANLGLTKNSECATIFEKVCPIGCNGRIGTEALLLDQCGVCGGDGSTCGDDDDGSCDATCIGLAVGIPLGFLLLVILTIGILCFTGVIAGGRRRRRRGQRRRNTTASHIPNEHFSAPIPTLTYAHQSKQAAVTMTSKKRISEIRWTNGKGKKNS